MSGQSAPPNGSATLPNDFTLALFRSWGDCNFEGLDNYFAGRASISAREIGLDEAFSQDKRILMLMRLLYHLKGAPGLLTFTETLIDRAQRYSACEEVWQARCQAKIPETTAAIPQQDQGYSGTSAPSFTGPRLLRLALLSPAGTRMATWLLANAAARNRSSSSSRRIERAPYATMLDLVEEIGHV